MTHCSTHDAEAAQKRILEMMQLSHLAHFDTFYSLALQMGIFLKIVVKCS